MVNGVNAIYGWIYFKKKKRVSLCNIEDRHQSGYLKLWQDAFSVLCQRKGPFLYLIHCFHFFQFQPTAAVRDGQRISWTFYAFVLIRHRFLLCSAVLIFLWKILPKVGKSDWVNHANCDLMKYFNVHVIDFLSQIFVMGSMLNYVTMQTYYLQRSCFSF